MNAPRFYESQHALNSVGKRAAYHHILHMLELLLLLGDQVLLSALIPSAKLVILAQKVLVAADSLLRPLFSIAIRELRSAATLPQATHPF